MSVRVMNLVFEHSRATGNDRVVLLVLADHADDDGMSAYPSQERIAAKAGGISDRTVRDCLKRLQEIGELEREGWSPVHTVSYRVTIGPLANIRSEGNPAASSGSNPAGSDTEPGRSTSTTRQPSSDKPSVKPPEEKNPPCSPPHDDFEGWLSHHQKVTGHEPPGPKTKARAELAAGYTARRAEGWTDEQLRLATIGANADRYRREHGYDVAESVLRPTKIGKLVNWGERAMPSNGRESDLEWARENLPDEHPQVVATARHWQRRGGGELTVEAVLERMRAEGTTAEQREPAGKGTGT